VSGAVKYPLTVTVHNFFTTPPPLTRFSTRSVPISAPLSDAERGSAGWVSDSVSTVQEPGESTGGVDPCLLFARRDQ